MGASGEADEWDFFVSYAGADRGWAEWVAWRLREGGYRVLVQAWHMVPASSWPERMAAGIAGATRTVALLSPHYLTSDYCAAEWQAAWKADPLGRAGKLLVVRVADCPVPAPLDGLVYADLFGIDEETARSRFVAAVAAARTGDQVPTEHPPFPASAASRSSAGNEPAPLVWGVPAGLPRNPHFVGRGPELTELHRRLGGDGSVAVLPQALHGLGGVGKTQLALEYAYRYARDYDVVWWMPAEQPALVVASLASLAGRLGVEQPDRAEAPAAAVEALRRGRPYPRWLVVVDNVGAPSDLHGLLTAAGHHGHVLVTSRDPSWRGRADTVMVDVLPRPDSVRLLRSHLDGIAAADAARVADVLGDLPLAIAQAGSWLSMSGMTVSRYLDVVHRRTSEILAEGTPADYPAPVAATWSLALEQVDTVSPAAGALLRLCAFCGPEPIPLDLFGPTTADLLPEPLRERARDPLTLARDVREISRRGLAHVSDGAIALHRLVQAVVRAGIDPADHAAHRHAIHAVLAANAPAEPDDPASWERFTELLPHALAAGLVEESDSAGRTLVTRLAMFLRARGDYPNSLAIARRAHERCTEALGADHEDTLVAAHSLALVLRSSGDHAAARALCDDVLTRRRSTLGDDHPATFKAMSFLAAALLATGDAAAARDLARRVLDYRRDRLGPDHPQTLVAASYLADAHRALGELDTARAMFEDVLSRRRRVLGDDHRQTLLTASLLAETLLRAGELTAARVLFDDTLAQRRRILGDDHPHTITTLSGLAETLRMSGDTTAAQRLFDEALSRGRRVLGDDHPGTVHVVRRLADLSEQTRDAHA